MAQPTVNLLLRFHGWGFHQGLSSCKAHGARTALAALVSHGCWVTPTGQQLTPALTLSTSSFSRQYSVQSAPAAAAVQAAQEPAKTAGVSGDSLVLPKWLRRLFPGGSDLAGGATSASAPASAQGAPEPSTDSSSDNKKASAQQKEDIKELQDLRDMTIAGYVEYCKKMRSGSSPPRPRTPPVSRSHYDYHLLRDDRRVAYLRTLQHERIGSLITTEEADTIVARGKDILRDRAFLEDIADRTGVYIDLEVKDCIDQFLTLRERGSQFYRYVVEHKRPMPKSEGEQREAIKFMERVDEEAELKAALARRDTQACPLRHKLPWAGPTPVCELTGLEYTQCCGRLSEFAAGLAGGQLAKAQSPQRAKGRAFEWDPQVHKAAHRLSKGRAEKRLRDAYIKATKPRFRDY